MLTTAVVARRFGIVEVLSGLREGERVVSEGVVKLRDGVTVRLDTDVATSKTESNGTPALQAAGLPAY